MLYIHIPFCESKCYYCSFNSYTEKNHLKENYFLGLEREFKEIEKPNKFNSIFIGGGTPSVMPIIFYEKLFSMLQNYIDKKTEITIEANPNSTSIEWLKGLKELGVNRVSFGVQSFDEEKLRFLGRNHSKKDAIVSLENCAKLFNNFNCDLIYNTILDSKELLEKDLNIVKSLGATHISAYSLTLEKGTKFEKDNSVQKGDEELELWFIEKIKESYPQYEISNFGKICNHNLGYWKLNNYIGLGAGAVGFKENRRFYNLNSVEEYLKNPLFKRVENLFPNQLKEEKVLLGLRSIVGFEEQILERNEKEKAFELLREDKLSYKNGRFYSKDFLLADALTLYILD